MDPSTPVQDGVLTTGGGGSGGAAAAGGMPLISPSDVHVLVVDDERLSRLVVGNQFRRCGYQVTVADGGMEALRVLQERPDGFNLILVDLMMPGLDGLQLLRILRADSNYNAIPIIMMSGNSNQATVLQCIAAGAEEYLVKPVTKRDVTHMWQHVWRRIQLVSNAPESLQNSGSLAEHSGAGASSCPDGSFNPSAGAKPLLSLRSSSGMHNPHSSFDEAAGNTLPASAAAQGGAAGMGAATRGYRQGQSHGYGPSSPTNHTRATSLTRFTSR
ncbi:unnamed protein product [Closterium sp. NIES-53]